MGGDKKCYIVMRYFSNRKRKGGIKLDDEDDEVSNPEDSEDEEVTGSGNDKKEDLASKQRVEDLWGAFKQDTAAVRRAASSTLKQKTEKNVDDKKQSVLRASTSSTVEKEEEEVPKKVEVTEIFDFAGEEVK